MSASIPEPTRRVRRISASATKEMAVIAAKVGGCVSLGQGVPSFATPPHIVEAAVQALRNDPASGKYTLQPGLPALKAAIARSLREQKNVVADPDSEIVVTVGAMEGLMAALLTLVEEGDQVIVPSPGYASHIEQILLTGGEPVFVPLRTEDWGLDVAAIRQAVTPKTKALILCNPGNPTGAVYEDDDVRALCDLALEAGFVLISDETYDVLVYGGKSPLSPASLPEMKQQVVSIASFSKKYAMTGWRVGWVYGPARYMDGIMKVHDAAVIAAPTVSQYAALAALEGPQGVVEDIRLALNRRRELCCARLNAMPDAFSYVKPKGAFYIMARYHFTNAPSHDVAVRLIHEAGVITIPGGSYGPGGEQHLRLSFGAEESDLHEAFDRIESWVKGSRT